MKQDVTTELFYDGAWNPAPIYERSQMAVKIGRPTAEGGDQPSSVEPVIDNRSAAYHPRNAGGALYGKIGRNTPVRVRVAAVSRFTGEAAGWLPGRSLDGNDSWVDLAAAGVSRRLGQGSTPARSAPHRFALKTDTPGYDPPIGYWPLDEGSLADLGQLAGGPPAYAGRMNFRVNTPFAIQPGEGELAPWLPSGVRLVGNTANPYVQADGNFGGINAALEFVYANGTGVWSGLFYNVSGDSIWRMRFDATTGEISVRLRTAGESGAETTLTTVAVPAAFDGRFHHARLDLITSGGNTVYTVYLDGVNVLSGTRNAEVITAATRVRIAGDTSSSNGVNIGHVFLWTVAPPGAAATSAAAYGKRGEVAGRRIERLCAEDGLTFSSTGNLDDTAPCGSQYTEPLLAVLRAAAGADLGILYDKPDAVGFHYRTRRSCENQAAALTLNFASRQVAPPFEPAGDDLPIRNDITVTRRNGSSFRAALTSGRLSTAAPPAGVGVYDETVTINLPGDGKFLEDQAGWRLHMGTVDEDRFPRLSVDLDRYPSLAAAVNALRPGDRIDVTDLPPHLSVDPLTLIIEGWTEQLGTHRRVITFNCAPESPYRVAVYQSGKGATVHKYDAAASTLDSGVTALATSLSVATPTGHPLWTTDDAEDGFHIGVGGEQIRVDDISGGASPQTFTVTRSINGVVKAHSAGGEVRLWQPAVYAL